MGGAFAIPCQAREQFAIVCCSIESNQTTYSHEENSYHRRDRLCRIRYSERSIRQRASSKSHRQRSVETDFNPSASESRGRECDRYGLFTRELAKSDAVISAFNPAGRIPIFMKRHWKAMALSFVPFATPVCIVS